jgi:hypothetical protein
MIQKTSEWLIQSDYSEIHIDTTGGRNTPADMQLTFSEARNAWIKSTFCTHVNEKFLDSRLGTRPVNTSYVWGNDSWPEASKRGQLSEHAREPERYRIRKPMLEPPK